MDKNSFLIELSESERTDFGRVDFPSQSEPQQVFSAIWELESQVNNGGFEQYFTNADPGVIAFTSSALLSVGALACADIFDEAVTIAFPEGIPSEEEARYQQIASLSEEDSARLGEFDEAFFERPDDLNDLLFAFVASQPEIFGPVPEDP